MHPSYSHMGLILFTTGKGLPPSIGGGGDKASKFWKNWANLETSNTLGTDMVHCTMTENERILKNNHT